MSQLAHSQTYMQRGALEKCTKCGVSFVYEKRGPRLCRKCSRTHQHRANAAALRERPI